MHLWTCQQLISAALLSGECVNDHIRDGQRNLTNLSTGMIGMLLIHLSVRGSIIVDSVLQPRSSAHIHDHDCDFGHVGCAIPIDSVHQRLCLQSTDVILRQFGSLLTVARTQSAARL